MFILSEMCNEKKCLNNFLRKRGVYIIFLRYYYMATIVSCYKKIHGPEDNTVQFHTSSSYFDIYLHVDTYVDT